MENKLNLEEIAKRLEDFKECKGLIIIGIEEGNMAREEFVRAKRRMSAKENIN